MDIKRLRKLRQKQGLTQEEMAKVLGYSRQRYNFYETGKREPDNETIVKLADFFEVSTDYLLGTTDDPTSPTKEKDPLEGLKFALWGHGDVTDEMLDDVRNFALYIEQKKKEKEQKDGGPS